MLQGDKPPLFDPGKPPAPDGAPAFAPPAAPPVAPAAPSSALAQAHDRLMHSRDLQFQFETPQPPTQPPDLSWLARILEVIGPLFRILFWVALAAVLGAILWFVAREVLRAKFPDRFKRKAKKEPPVEWRPEADAARALLEDADALAAQGRFAEAAHLLLLRSVEDIEGRDAKLLRPSLTSRDIAELEALPSPARGAFGRITDVVERSFFGGRDVDAGGWAECRRAYADFALPGRWSPA